ncbi:MAG: hypothetical protein FD138_3506 [Planctomycetota bacterium]|nr:MAG: hypothetical protein FD138_3506 [Planctomycetota bacterium]
MNSVPHVRAETARAAATLSARQPIHRPNVVARCARSWVKAELQERFNLRCCESLEEFQQSHERALTRQRHLKLNRTRHEKDDRDRVADPRYFVLGWDNRDKKRRLTEAIESFRAEVARIDSQVRELSERTEQLRRRIVAVEAAERFKTFAEIDFATLTRHRSLAVPGTGRQPPPPQHLTSSELLAFGICRQENLRIEQERLPQPDFLGLTENSSE